MVEQVLKSAMANAEDKGVRNSGDLVVTADLRKGYTLHGRVVRPALVTVGHQD